MWGRDELPTAPVASSGLEIQTGVSKGMLSCALICAVFAYLFYSVPVGR